MLTQTSKPVAKATAKVAQPGPGQHQATAQLKNYMSQIRSNHTGLSDNLKTGMENLSGFNLDHVRVFRDSDKPALVQAHAYTQGSNIYLASGQEQHLPHELGHVIQQMQGRVKSTAAINGVALNDDPRLELEATRLGQMAVAGHTLTDTAQLSASPPADDVMQMKTEVVYKSQKVNFRTKPWGKMEQATVGETMAADLDPKDPIKGSEPNLGGTNDELYKTLNSDYGYGKKSYVRGHMLNDHLGGLGVAENLFPLTYAANHAHLEQAESLVKALLLQGENIVEYTVSAMQQDTGANFIKSPKSTLSYSIATQGVTLVNKTIIVDPGTHNPSLNQQLTDAKYGKASSGLRKSENEKQWLEQGEQLGYVRKSDGKTLALIE